MPEDKDIEELKKLYLERENTDDIFHQSKTAAKGAELTFNKTQMIFISAVIIPISLLIFILGFIAEKIIIPSNQEKQPLSIKYQPFFPKIPDQIEAGGSLSAGVTLINDLTKHKSAFYVTVIPLDFPPSPKGETIQVPPAIPKKELKKELVKITQPDEGKPLTSAKKKKDAFKKGNYTVQVGSYRNKKQADLLIDTLNKKGFRAYLVKTDLPNKGLRYRVRMGYFSTRKEAEKLSSEIRTKDKLQNYVTLTSK